MPSEYSLSYTKARYREIFRQAQSALDHRLMALMEGLSCDSCQSRPTSPLAPLHPGCGYRAWQARAIDVIENDIGREIYQALQGIEAEKQRTSCHMCGLCCRMASSEYSYEELLEKAAQGDDFARQFTSIFLPYASLEAARKRLPAVVEATLSEAGHEAGNQTGDDAQSAPKEEEEEEEGKRDAVYFYHCPYVGEDNRCTIFGTDKRPAICSQYPDTPLTFMVDECAWKPWKDANHPQTLLAHALIELGQHYVRTLRGRLEINPEI